MPSKPMLSEEDKAEIRKRLKALCEGRWIARGYKRTSVKELCAAAGISIGTFYVLYPAKEDLFLETIRDIQERLKEQVLETNRRERSRGGLCPGAEGALPGIRREALFVQRGHAGFPVLRREAAGGGRAADQAGQLRVFPSGGPGRGPEAEAGGIPGLRRAERPAVHGKRPGGVVRRL